jgi:mannose-1-phosphate guanylyltransferase
VQDLIIVSAKDALLITSRSHAESIKKLADQLPKELK